MQRLRVINSIQNQKVIAVVRASNSKEAEEIAKSAYEGGIRIIELTFTTPNVLTSLTNLKDLYGEDMIIGIGTVLDKVAARLAIEKGADFIVTPHFDKNIVEICHLYQIPIIPGATNPKEIVDALKAGCGIIKIFPANVVGPKVISSFKGPFPQADFIPTGGVSIDSLQEWLTAGALAVGTGSELTKDAIKTGDFSKIVAYARKLVEIVEANYERKVLDEWK